MLLGAQEGQQGQTHFSQRKNKLIIFQILPPSWDVIVFFKSNPHLWICLLTLDREEGGGRERHQCKREKHQLIASHTCPDQGSNLQPR